jgi:hypothetical protein
VESVIGYPLFLIICGKEGLRIIILVVKLFIYLKEKGRV